MAGLAEGLSEPEVIEAAAPQLEEFEPRFGRATPLVVLAGLLTFALLSWWLLGDPEWSPVAGSLPAVNADLFWVILALIWTGFTFASWPFTKLRQPLSGLAQAAFTVVLGFFCVWLFTSVVGSWDPTFSRHTAGGAGYTASAFIVLIGFYAFAFAAASWGGYPFENESAPTSSLAQWFMAACITVVGVVVLVYPNFNEHLVEHAPLKLVDALGWVYSSIVIVIMGAQLWDNWPWAGVKNRHLRALTALLTTLLGGLLLYWLLGFVIKAVVPADIKALPTFSVSQETAAIGVCFSFWSLFWGLVVGGWPHHYGAAVNRLVKFVIVAILATGTYVLFMRVLGTKVFHYPAIKGNYGGEPLSWIDWLILCLLWYTVAFGSYGSIRARRASSGRAASAQAEGGIR